MGRKRKVPPGYIPRWNSDDSDDSELEGTKYGSTLNLNFPSTCRTNAPNRKRVRQQELGLDHHREGPLHPTQEQEPPLITNYESNSSSVDMEDREELDHTVEMQTGHTEGQEGPVQGQYQGILSDESENGPAEQLEINPGASVMEDAFWLQELSDNYEWDDSEDEDKESFRYILGQFSEQWLLNEINHKVSKTASGGFWDLANKWMFKLTSAFNRENKKKIPQFGYIRQKLVKANVPDILMDTGYVNKETQELIVVENAKKIPVRDFPPDKFEKVFEISSVKV